jgi:hypothetical protein
MDMPGAFMQADMDRLVHLDLLLEVDREMYAPHGKSYAGNYSVP